MALRSTGRKVSFDILSTSILDDDHDSSSIATCLRSNSDPSPQLLPIDDTTSPTRNRKKKRKKKKYKRITEHSTISEFSLTDGQPDCSFPVGESNGYCYSVSQSSSVVVCEEHETLPPPMPHSNCSVSSVAGLPFGELRQRNVMVNGVSEESVGSPQIVERECESVKELESRSNSRVEVDLNMDGIAGRSLEKEVSLDWKRLMAEDPNQTFPVDKSPVKCFMEEMYAGNSLRSTVALGNEKERERVYDTIFRLPWRCELLIDVGFFVCLDSFLSLLTVMPTRLIMICWRFLKTRQFKKLSAVELSDIGCSVALASGVILLQQTDISLIYHMIRGQGTIKLYVVYNVLEVFDKLFQSFGGDVMQTLFNTAEGLANSSTETQAITLSTCIVAHNNALFALLVSNNFAEIKSNVFKRYSKDNVHNLVYYDSVERFHISAFLLFVLAQNLLEADGPWFGSFICNALVVYLGETTIDIIKHSFIAKFNNIKPIAFSEFLEDLCKQTLNIQTDNVKNNLTFVPLAPACVVIRVLRPVFAARLPYNPLPWRLFWIFLLSTMTFVMLASLKVMISIGLKKHARWYINRCQRRKLHSD
ncbi:Transmembrane anterior posterior transformation protein 1 [Datura stramonium]|uniref:Transmembrane anterior posterior transformation protein 1 n=1 Tax=Datura stramonium TaxID=4076 RepID=A0ABS8V1D9_DATST|nr:Transmembrane anterior posterior transformation protein 1 [Datura stramonium]